VKRINGGKSWYLKVFLATLYLPVAGIFVSSRTTTVTWVVFGMALVSLVILIVQVINGNFRREIIHNHKVHLTGTMIAATIGVIWLSRARKALRFVLSLSPY